MVSISACLTITVLTGLWVTGAVLHPLALAVPPPVLGYRVLAFSIGELHSAPAGPGTLPPRPPQAPAPVYHHLRRPGGKVWLEPGTLGPLWAC